MNDVIISSIVNRYADHNLPPREWTQEEREALNEALRQYGWKDTPVEEVKS